MDTRERATQLLNRLGSGEQGVAEELMQIVYGELHELARGHMAREAQHHTLQPTALVNEAWMRLVRQPEEASWESRKQFYSMASKVMRSLLVDHARAKKAGKRGGDRVRVALDGEAPLEGTRDDVDLLDLDEALVRLAQSDEELARAVELRFFGGLSMQQAADALDLPLRTAERRLRVATAWLREHLDG